MKRPSIRTRARVFASPLAMAMLLLIGLAVPSSAVAGRASNAALDELISIHRSAGTQAVPLRSSTPSDGLNDAIRQRPQEAPASAVTALDVAKRECPALLQHAFVPIQGGATQSMCQFHGKVLLVVNTASECGYTPQYEGLEALYRKYRGRGLVVVGFPSNDFGGQEPGSNQDIAQFCRTVYGVQFPMFEKQAGAKLSSNPFYAELISTSGQSPRWNFHKFLIDRSGTKVRSFDSAIEPQSRELARLLDQWLADKPAFAQGRG